MIDSRLDALFIGTPRAFRNDGATSTIGSRVATTAPVTLTHSGFEGDAVADPSVHGGSDKAVHFYPAEHYPAWRADAKLADMATHPMLAGAGGFGENLSASHLTEDRVKIGDRFRIGTALLEISQGRQPCWKIDHHFGRKGMTAAVIRSRRSGFYFRVIEGGQISARDRIEQICTPNHDWTVARVFALLIGGAHKRKGGAQALRELQTLDSLADSWRKRAAKLLG
jgi:MOSC domain-containing protein YiiM